MQLIARILKLSRKQKPLKGLYLRINKYKYVNYVLIYGLNNIFVFGNKNNIRNGILSPM